MIILGINAFHADSSATLVKDGALAAAAEEERFRRVKHWAGFPSQSIADCQQEAGLHLHDVDHVAVIWTTVRTGSASSAMFSAILPMCA